MPRFKLIVKTVFGLVFLGAALLALLGFQELLDWLTDGAHHFDLLTHSDYPSFYEES